MPFSKSFSRRERIAIGLLVATVSGSVAGSVFLIQHWEYVSRLQHYGYLGLFLVALLAGSPVPIPTPSMILTFTLGSVLNPLLVGVVSGIGNASGTVLVYLTGRGGRHFFPNLDLSDPASEAYSSRLGRFLKKIRMPRILDFANRRGATGVFLLSIYPNPILTPMVLSMGAMRFRFTRFFLACWAGKTVQAMVLAYLGYLGLRSLLRLFGVFDVS